MANHNSILRLPAVKSRTGLGKSKIYELEMAGRFPRHINIAGTSAIGWLESEIDTWVAAQFEQEPIRRTEAWLNRVNLGKG